MHVRSFSPIIAPSSRVLILGSMPGRASLQAQQYYAHPRNAFWAIMEDALGVPRTAPYETRLALLAARGVSLWDVLAECRRSGSLDASIERASERPNPIAACLTDAPSIHTILCNGNAAFTLFHRHIQPCLTAPAAARILVEAMPSTSPAYAAMSYEAKRARWSAALARALENAPGH